MWGLGRVNVPMRSLGRVNVHSCIFKYLKRLFPWLEPCKELPFNICTQPYLNVHYLCSHYN